MKKSSFKKIFGMKVFLAVMILLLFLFGLNFFKEYNRNRQLNKQIKELEKMAQEMEAQNLDILNMAKYLDTEEFLESEARTKLGLQKPGEKTIIVNIPGAGEPTTSTDISEAVQEKSNAKCWWEYFFKK